MSCPFVSTDKHIEMAVGIWYASVLSIKKVWLIPDVISSLANPWPAPLHIPLISPGLLPPVINTSCLTFISEPGSSSVTYLNHCELPSAPAAAARHDQPRWGMSHFLFDVFPVCLSLASDDICAFLLCALGAPQGSAPRAPRPHVDFRTAFASPCSG